MSQGFFIGIDGGASKSKAVLMTAAGQILATSTAGPANIAISVTAAWQSVTQLIQHLLQQAKLDASHLAHLNVGIGIAGCEFSQAYQAFCREPHPYAQLKVISDAHTACLGAHLGADGAIIVIGTGSVAYQITKGMVYKVGGWGFPYDDAGSGAWIGFKAFQYGLRYLDGRKIADGLVERVLKFAAADEPLIDWASRAKSTQFAQLAPLVIEAAKQHVASAEKILQSAALEIELLAQALHKQSQIKPSISLIGGIAPYLLPYCSTIFQQRLIPAQASPEMGAILMFDNFQGQLCT